MRYSASEKFEIIELVEQSSLSIRRTLAPIGIPRSTFYDWYRREGVAASDIRRSLGTHFACSHVEQAFGEAVQVGYDRDG